MAFQFLSSTHREWASTRADSATAHASGWAVVDGRLLRGADLAGYFLEHPDPALLHGQFALVLEGTDEVVLIADHIRSIPLFFRLGLDGVAVSDHAGELGRGGQLDSDSVWEFAAAGYVTGPHTLHADVSGVQAGELVRITDQGPGQEERFTVERTEWFSHRCSHDAAEDIPALCASHSKAVDAAFGRTIQSLEGRQAVVPLSGGLDSRLVAERLARAGYPKVLCFTYGLKDNFEARTARETAQRLGLEWTPVEYTPQALRQALNSPEFQDYCRFVSAGVSAPHPDDWLAVKLLIEQGRVEPDAVFLPGHTGDFLCGSHLKYLFDPEENADPLDFDPAMIRKHYGLWDRLARDGREVFSRRMAEAVGGVDRSTESGVAQAYEFWEWRERQAKFIVNAVRVYEFFGHDFRVPLWDRELMAFWQPVPVAFKLDKHLYRACLEADDPSGVFAGVSRPRFDREEVAAKQARKSARLSRRLRRGLARLPLVGRLLWYLGRVRFHARVWERHPSGLARVYGKWRYRFLQPGKRHVMSLLARDFLAREHGVQVRALTGTGSQGHSALSEASSKAGS